MDNIIALIAFLGLAVVVYVIVFAVVLALLVAQD
jgi:hypothetical protein